MSHDISVDGSPNRTRVMFDDFVATDLPTIASAVVVVLAEIDAADQHADLLQAALDEARAQWHSIDLDDRPGRFVYAHVLADAMARSGDGLPITVRNLPVDAACAVARYGLAWLVDEIGAIVDLFAGDVAARLEVLDGDLPLATSTSPGADAAPLPERIRSAMLSAAVILPDTKAIDDKQRRVERHKRTRRALVAAAALVVALVTVTQFITRPERPDRTAIRSSSRARRRRGFSALGTVRPGT